MFAACMKVVATRLYCERVQQQWTLERVAWDHELAPHREVRA
jgi:hypothetical protein